MVRGFLLGAILVLGVEPLSQFIWELFWKYQFPKMGGGVMDGLESSLIRAGVMLFLVIIVGIGLYFWGKKENKNSIAAIKEALGEVIVTTDEQRNQEIKDLIIRIDKLIDLMETKTNEPPTKIE